MKKKLNIIFTLVVIFLAISDLSAQKRAVYYLQNGSPYATMQWTKMTHFVHSFFNPILGTTTTHNGNVTDATGVPNTAEGSSIWFTTANFTNQRTAALAANPAIKIIISVGGAPTASEPNITIRLNYILADAARRNEFSSDLAAFIQNYNLDGFDFDLEHPVSQAEKDNHQAFLALMRTKLDALEPTMCKKLEISIALNGETDKFVVNPSGADYVNPGVDPYVDYYNLMTYDASFAAHNAVNANWPLNHSPLIHVQEAVRDFANPPFNWSKSKMVIGIPFYGRTSGGATQTYLLMGAGKFNDADDNVGGYTHNDCPTIQDKVNFAIAEGLAGVLVWEASQDEPNASGISLTSCLWTAISTGVVYDNKCCNKPSLGPDRITCSTPFPITLDANISGGTIVWTRLLPSPLLINAAGLQTQVITAVNGAGTYVVSRSFNGCISADTVVITSATALPSPGISNRTLCSVPYTLTPTNVSAFPTGTTFQWQRASVNLAGETASTIYASMPGTYTLIASLAGCTGSNASATITASSASPVDACRTSTGTLALSVTGGTGPFTWYSGPIPNNTILASNTSTFTTPSLPLPSTTYYYVEDAGAQTNVSVGINAAPTGFYYDVTNPPVINGISMEFEVVNELTLKTVDVYLGSFGVIYPLSATFEIINAHGFSVYTSAVINFPSWTSAVQIIPLNASLAKGKYRLRGVKAGPPANDLPSFGHHTASTFPYGTGGDLVITRQRGVGQYGPFYNWRYGDYNSCPRILVRATVSASCSSALPVELISFAAEKNGNDVQLNWVTGSEKNNHYFGVQRSLDGVSFTTIGTVNGHDSRRGNLRYEYLDTNVPKQVLYYRLAQHDFDGTVAYSPIKTIQFNASMQLSIRPNPTASSSLLSVAGVEGVLQLSIFDLTGKVMQTINSEAGTDTSIGNELPSGLYVVRVVSSSSVVSEVFIKE